MGDKGKGMLQFVEMCPHVYVSILLSLCILSPLCLPVLLPRHNVCAEGVSAMDSSSSSGTDSSSSSGYFSPYESSSSSAVASPLSSSTGGFTPPPPPSTTSTAVASLFAGSTNPLFSTVNGTVLFTQNDVSDMLVTLTITVWNLPQGIYGIHVHQYGDVSSSFPISSAITGSHWNPAGVSHGCWPSANRHVGDIGNITIDSSPDPHVIILTRDLLQLSISTDSIIGRSVIIHQTFDNCGQPTGNAGSYIAQGVIGIPAPATGLTQVSASVLTAEPASAVAVLVPTATNTAAPNIKGEVWFQTLPSGNVSVVLSLTGLPPSKTLALHVHSWGSLLSADGTAAGLHYDPFNTSHHALPPNEPRHMGDMGNIVTSDANGNAFSINQFDLLTLTGDMGNIIGRAVVLHSSFDDGVTQPTGMAGSRLAVGVIGISSQQNPPRLPLLPLLVLLLHCGCCTIYII